MSETETDPVVTQAVDQLLGGNNNPVLRKELIGEAEDALEPGMTGPALAHEVQERRIAAGANSDPKTWPGVSDARPGDANEATITQPNRSFRPGPADDTAPAQSKTEPAQPTVKGEAETAQAKVQAGKAKGPSAG